MSSLSASRPERRATLDICFELQDRAATLKCQQLAHWRCEDIIEGDSELFTLDYSDHRTFCLALNVWNSDPLSMLIEGMRANGAMLRYVVSHSSHVEEEFRVPRLALMQTNMCAVLSNEVGFGGYYKLIKNRFGALPNTNWRLERLMQTLRRTDTGLYA